MRRIAAELDVSPKLLYYHIKNKDELFDLLPDAITSRCSLPSKMLSWQERIIQIECTLFEEILKFPGVPSRALIRSTQDFNAPHASLIKHEVKEALTQSGLNEKKLKHAYSSIYAFFMGHLILTEAQLSTSPITHHENQNNIKNFSINFKEGLRYLISGFEQRAAHN